MRSLLITLAAAASAVVVAGCGSGSSSSTASAAPTSAVTSAVATTPAPTTSDGLTPNGTTLAIGQPATIAYETKSLSKLTSKLKIAVTSVKQGSIDDLKNFQLDAQTKLSVPFYVTATFDNVGDKSVDPGGIFGLVNALDPAGDKLGYITLLGDFSTCDGTPPDHLAPGASFTQCEVYVAPKGESIANVVLDHFLDTGTDSIETKVTWKN